MGRRLYLGDAVNLLLTRTHFAETFTIGSLYIDEKWICYTLEDKVREVEGHPVSEWKVFGQTAIPRGIYPVKITFSNHFQKDLPELKGVEGFEGVRIHTGNSDKDTEGCILVGSFWDGASDWISESGKAYAKLIPQLIEPISLVVS